MKKKYQLFKFFPIRIVFPVALIFVLALLVASCQKDEFAEPEDMPLKTAVIPELTLNYPTEEINAGEDFDITFSSSCGKVLLQRGYINGDPILDGSGKPTRKYEKVYIGLTCDTPGLLWESLYSKDQPCSGGIVTQNWTEPGTYVYRAKLNQKAIKNTGCPDCVNFRGTLMECFMITVVEGNSGTFTDNRDSKEYGWIKIGDQVWMSENLAYSAATGSWAYNNDMGNVDTYGMLYDWNTAMNGATGTYDNPSGIQGICPAGWHLPSYFEWDQLTDNFPDTPGADLKEAGTAHWTPPPPPFGFSPGTNSSGFTALPGGFYNGSDFLNLGVTCTFWSASGFGGSATTVHLSNESSQLWNMNFPVNYGLSVRCVKD